jgi:hypothetical protein
MITAALERSSAVTVKIGGAATTATSAAPTPGPMTKHGTPVSCRTNPVIKSSIESNDGEPSHPIALRRTSIK